MNGLAGNASTRIYGPKNWPNLRFHIRFMKVKQVMKFPQRQPPTLQETAFIKSTTATQGVLIIDKHPI